MRTEDISSLFVIGLVSWAGTAGRQRLGIDELGEQFQADGTFRPSSAPRLRLKRAAQKALVAVAARFEKRSRGVAARELAETFRRLEELSPHLLEDIGVRKLVTGEYEHLREARQEDCDPVSPGHHASPA